MTRVEVSIIDEALVRLADRLRSLPESRLARADDRLGGDSLAHACHAFAQWCADATPGTPTTAVPRLHDLAAGDQVLVVGRELLHHLEQTPSPELEQELMARLATLRTLT